MMKTSLLNYRSLILFVNSMLLSCSPAHTDRSTAFFYGHSVPVDSLSQYKQVVVEPENMSKENLDFLNAKGVKVFAYISIGEVNRTRSWYSDIPKKWFAGNHEAWGSDIVDLTNEGWHDFLVDQYMTTLWNQGYRGFFFDTLDSYHKTSVEFEDKLTQERALITLITRIHEHFPGVDLIFNRGFEVLPAVGQYATALAAESLFQGWDQSKQEYAKVSESDREWLLNKLKEAKKRYKFQIIVIDYVDPDNKELTQKTSKEISRLGFTPWVANPALNMIGVGPL